MSTLRQKKNKSAQVNKGAAGAEEVVVRRGGGCSCDKAAAKSARHPNFCAQRVMEVKR